jgi:hypothetical protein
MPAVKRPVFKSLARPAIQKAYEIGIRNDIQDLDGGGWYCGCKGIRDLDLVTARH